MADDAVSCGAGPVAKTMNLDERLLRLARTCGHDPRTEHAVARFSRLGEHGAVWFAIGAAGYALDRERRSQWRGAMRAVAATYASNTLTKLAVRRRRPELPDLPPLIATPTRLSFPSAHASTSFAGACAYSRLGLPAGPLYALAGGLAMSRLYLGVHYPSDVLAGGVLGSVVGTLVGRPAGVALREEARRLGADSGDRAEMARLREEMDEITPLWPAD